MHPNVRSLLFVALAMCACAPSVAGAAEACARSIARAHSRVAGADLRRVWACAIAVQTDAAAAEKACAPLRTPGIGLDRVTSMAMRDIRVRCQGQWPLWMPEAVCDSLPHVSDRARIEACVVHGTHCAAVRAVAEVLGDAAVEAIRDVVPGALDLDLGGVAGNRLAACLESSPSTTTTTTIAAPTTTTIIATTTLPPPTTTLPEPPPTTTVPELPTTLPDPTTTTLVDAPTTTMPQPSTTLPPPPTTTLAEPPTTTLPEPTTTLPPPPTTTLPDPPTTLPPPPTTTLPEPTTTTIGATTTLPIPTTTIIEEPTTTMAPTTTLPDPTTTTTTTSTTLPPGPPRLVITEIASNPEAVSDAAGEYFEILNSGAAAVDLLGLVVRDAGSDTFTVSTSLIVDAGEHVILARSISAAAGNVDYVYGSAMSLTNSTDTIALRWNGELIDSVTYGSGFPLVAGAAMSLRPSVTDGTGNDGSSAWCRETAALGNGDFGSPRTATASCTP